MSSWKGRRLTNPAGVAVSLCMPPVHAQPPPHVRPLQRCRLVLPGYLFARGCRRLHWPHEGQEPRLILAAWLVRSLMPGHLLFASNLVKAIVIPQLAKARITPIAEQRCPQFGPGFVMLTRQPQAVHEAV